MSSAVLIDHTSLEPMPISQVNVYGHCLIPSHLVIVFFIVIILVLILTMMLMAAICFWSFNAPLVLLLMSMCPKRVRRWRHSITNFIKFCWLRECASSSRVSIPSSSLSRLITSTSAKVAVLLCIVCCQMESLSAAPNRQSSLLNQNPLPLSSSPPKSRSGPRCLIEQLSDLSNVVKIKYGTVQGVTIRLDRLDLVTPPPPPSSSQSFNGTSSGSDYRTESGDRRLSPIEAYLGVPYASPPTGALRFMPPVTPSHWRGVRPANQLAPLCPQRIAHSTLVMHNTSEALRRMPQARFEWLRRMIPRSRNQSEDCLYLNIYTPAIDLSLLARPTYLQSDLYSQYSSSSFPQDSKRKRRRKRHNDQNVIIDSFNLLFSLPANVQKQNSNKKYQQNMSKCANVNDNNNSCDDIDHHNQDDQLSEVEKEDRKRNVNDYAILHEEIGKIDESHNSPIISSDNSDNFNINLQSGQRPNRPKIVINTGTVGTATAPMITTVTTTLKTNQTLTKQHDASIMAAFTRQLKNIESTVTIKQQQQQDKSNTRASFHSFSTSSTFTNNLQTKKTKSRLKQQQKSIENSSTVPLNLPNHMNNNSPKQHIKRDTGDKNEESSSSANSNYSKYRSGYYSSSSESQSLPNEKQFLESMTIDSDKEKKRKVFQEPTTDNNNNNNDNNDEDDGIYVESYNDGFQSDDPEFNSRVPDSYSQPESMNIYQNGGETHPNHLHHHHRHRSVPSNISPLNPSSTTSSTSTTTSNGGATNIKSKSDYNFPVLVLITGESYDWNLGSLFDPSLLASFGQAVVVTLNFRLGILGFLPANVDGAMRGNYGLMDQVAALHWIQENIAEFGGSPSNVTIIGHGHGAACAHLLMLSPMAKGLFNRVILMSGSSLSPWAIARDASTYAREVGKQLNCPLNDNTLMVECLRSKTVEQLLSVNFQVPDYLTAFGPIIDGIVVPSEPRIMLHESTASQNTGYNNANNFKRTSNSPNYASSLSSPSSSSSLSTSSTSSGPSTGHFLHHRLHHHAAGVQSSYASPPPQPDLMVGVTRVESPPIFSSYEERNGISVARRDRILRTLVRNSFDYHQQAIFYTLINEYTDWTRSAEHPISLIDSLIELLGDALVVAPLVESLDHQYFSSSSVGGLQLGSGSKLANSGLTNGNLASSGSRSRNTNSRAYFYVFSHQENVKSNQDNSKKHPNSLHDRLGASHSEELAYLFGLPLLGSLRTSLIANHNFIKCDNNNRNEERNNEEDEDEEGEEEELDDDELDYLEYSSISNRNINRLLRYPTLDISPTNHDHFTDTTSSASSQQKPSSGSSSPIKVPRQFNYSQSDVNLSKLIISYWIHFASYGDPNIFWRQSPSNSHHSRSHYRDYNDDRDDDEEQHHQDQEMGGNQLTEKGEIDGISMSSHPRRFHHRSQRLNEIGMTDDGSDDSGSIQRGTNSAEIVASGNSYRSYHLSQLNQNGYQHLENCRLDSALWPSYDTLQRKYLHFGSRVKVRDHYHSHRLSIWLSLIPRLHIPIEFSNNHNNEVDQSDKETNPEGESNGDKATDQFPELDPEQYFYLRHHLLPDHENFATYDGVVKQLTIRVPGSKQWQQKYIKPNQTLTHYNSYDHLYGRLLASSGGGNGHLSASSGTIIDPNKHQLAINSLASSHNGKQQVMVHSEIAGRRIDQKNPNNGGVLFGQSSSAVDGGNNAANLGPNGDTGDDQNGGPDGGAGGGQMVDPDLEFYDVSTTATTSVLHYEAQTSDLYSTALLVTIVVGCSLLILNLLIFIGVYYQLDHKKDGTDSGGNIGSADEMDDSGTGTGETSGNRKFDNEVEEEEEEDNVDQNNVAISSASSSGRQKSTNFMETSEIIVSNNNNNHIYGNKRTNQSAININRISPAKQRAQTSSSNSNSTSMTNNSGNNLNYQNVSGAMGNFRTLNKSRDICAMNVQACSSNSPRSVSNSSKYKTLPLRPNSGHHYHQSHQNQSPPQSGSIRSQRRRSSPRTTSTYHHFYSPEHSVINNNNNNNNNNSSSSTSSKLPPIPTSNDTSNMELYYTSSAAMTAASNCNQCNPESANIISIEQHPDNSYYIYQQTTNLVDNDSPNPNLIEQQQQQQQYNGYSTQSNNNNNSTNSNSSTPLKSILKNSHNPLRNSWDPQLNPQPTSIIDPSATILNVYSATGSIPAPNGSVQFISCSQSSQSPMTSVVPSADQSTEFISFISASASNASANTSDNSGTINQSQQQQQLHHHYSNGSMFDPNGSGPIGAGTSLMMPYYTLTELYTPGLESNLSGTGSTTGSGTTTIATNATVNCNSVEPNQTQNGPN